MKQKTQKIHVAPGGFIKCRGVLYKITNPKKEDTGRFYEADIDLFKDIAILIKIKGGWEMVFKFEFPRLYIFHLEKRDRERQREAMLSKKKR